MDFFKRGEKRPSSFDHSRILVPVLGDDEVDGPALKVATLLLGGRDGVEASLLHVIEIPFDRTLDAEDEAAVAPAPSGTTLLGSPRAPRSCPAVVTSCTGMMFTAVHTAGLAPSPARSWPCRWVLVPSTPCGGSSVPERCRSVGTVA